MKTLTDFNAVVVQKNVQQFWKEQGIYKKAKQKVSGNKEYYFIDGPPYTSGQVHLGTAWNKSLKDMLLRIKRMQGYDVWDRAGYDMHGLPIEHATEKKLGIKGAQQIQEYGVDAFIRQCKEFATEHMLTMSDVFKELGVWMDFDDPYQTMSKTYMDGEWWFIKQAFEKNRLYEGLRTTMWDATDATAVAKHESEYKNIEDTAIFVKFPILNSENEYLLIWTTTPWTIPFNLAVMVGPDLDYQLVDINGEHFWIAKDLVESVTKQLDAKAKLIREVKGSELEGMAYTHPFAKDMGYDALKLQHEKLHTVLLSKEYVDTTAGSGLVHCAPGCGPEDFEVGYRNGLPAFNTVNVHGEFENSGCFSGMKAKFDDKQFIDMIDANGSLVHQHSYVHDYPHAERSKQPVIFRTTKQWFIKVDDIKNQLTKENNEVLWLPKAGYNAFNSWLENIRDNSISKQRFWGTPIPVWRNIEDPEDILVIGSAKELEELSGQKVGDLHISTVDKIPIQKDGKTYERIKDVLDVWVDAGTALWNAKRRSTDEDISYTPIEFITEGKDQIRGWFNLLHVVSNVAFGKKAFKCCYMHGYINDTSGRKMSKSLQNYIKPEEVTSKFGADTFRFYVIGGANPGLDLNYNFDDIDLRQRNLNVLWNTHKYALDLALTHGFATVDMPAIQDEERYIFSRLHSMVKQVNEMVDSYRLNEVPALVEQFFLDLSRTYIQLVREKASSGTKDEQQTVFGCLLTCLETVMRLMAPITPHITEQLYANSKELGIQGVFNQESVHIESWPQADSAMINTDLEMSFDLAQDIITYGLSARDKAKLGVRWPSAAITLDVDEKTKNLVQKMSGLIKQQLNVKDILFDTIPVKYKVKPNYRMLGKAFGQKTADVLTLLKDDAVETEIAKAISAEKESFGIKGFDFERDMFDLEVVLQQDASVVLFENGKLELDTVLSSELEAEGFSREITRRLQNLRKNSGLQKADVIDAQIVLGDLPSDVMKFKEAIMETCGAQSFDAVEKITLDKNVNEKVKGRAFIIGLNVR